MAELIAIRTFINLKVFAAIPESDLISLTDLSKATGAQESLLSSWNTGYLAIYQPVSTNLQ